MAADVARIAFAQREYRTIVVEDETIKEKHPLAVELEYNTLIGSQIEAEEFGNLVLGLRKEDRYSWSCYVNKHNYDLRLGQTVTLQHPRFGMSGGKNFIVKRVKRDSKSVYDEVTLFGPE